MTADSVNPSCSGTGATTSCFDSSLEAAFNLISRRGLASKAPGVWGEDRDSEIGALANAARGGYFSQPPSIYPSGAVFSNTDVNGYKRQLRMFAFLSVTSLLGVHQNRKLWYDSNGVPCSLSQNNQNGDTCSFWKPLSLSLMEALLPDASAFLNSDLSHTLRCTCGDVGGKAPDGRYDVLGGLAGVKEVSQCQDVTVRCPDDDHVAPGDDGLGQDDEDPFRFPWIVLVVAAAVLLCCCVSWLAFLYVGKNMGDSDRRRGPKEVKVRGVPASRMVQMGAGKARAGGVRGGGGKGAGAL